MTRLDGESRKDMRDRNRDRRVSKKLANHPNRGKSKPVRKMSRGQELYLFEHRPYVDQIIDTGGSIKSVVDYLRSRGFKTTPATVTKYKKAREGAIRYKGFAEFSDFGDDRPDYNKMKRLDDKTKAKLLEKHLSDLADSSGGDFSDKTMRVSTERGSYEYSRTQQLNAIARKRKRNHLNSKDRVMTDVQFLDVMIQKGMDTLATMPQLDPGKALKAIELKHKLTEGRHGGVTMYGMEEIRLRENARENAMTEVILNFVPEEKRAELLEQLEFTTEEFYRQHGLEEAYTGSSVDDIESYLEDEGLEPEEDDSYYNDEEVGDS